ncbi:PaaI family thioesterase [Calderihabitans maritimus]|uniref:Thioesterase n=1 Tax=Calderihabitans maritimus TaxID=1246530 RepID=A0A1Z5HV17_9FIRM|nr:PaaI family thioesterase [Calderihabitans maritimus]GAW93197.1 thioesterase [Calderihabitans maritimus]
MKLQGDTMCFACGVDNPIGLKLSFREENGLYMTEFTPRKEFQGWAGILHGGITSTVLDEVMGHYLYTKGLSSVTVELQVRFLKPIPVEETVRAYGKVVDETRRLITAEAWIELPNGEKAAEARGKFLLVKR